ncbi:MAG: hypothetical protein WDA65_07740 [Christensenellales bacterium]
MKRTHWFIWPVIIMLALCACGQDAGTFGAADLAFEIDGQKFPLRTSVAPLLAALGDDYDMESGPSCLYEGEDKQFYYDNVFIFTFPMDGEDLIDQLCISGGEYTTAKGIGIGSTLEDIEAKYGTDWFDIDGECVYVVSGNPDDLSSQKLFFELEDGKVSGFTYYGAANAS